MRPTWWCAAAVALALVTALWGSGLVTAETQSTRKPTERSTRADRPTGDLAEIEKKVDQLLANQETLLQRFDAVMEELRIIKVRATISNN